MMLGKLPNKDRIKSILQASSSHASLLKEAELEALEKYFASLQRKDELEQEMDKTYRVAVNAKYCAQVGYV